MKTKNSQFKPSGDSVLFLGDAREELARELLAILEKVISARSGREAYYILVHSRKHPFMQGVLRTVITILDAQPPKMLGTVCFRVDNRAGRAERLWVLPLDIPRSAALVTSEWAPSVADDVVGIPIILS